MAGGTQRHGRNKKKCERYRAEGRRERNKARKLAKQKKRLERLTARTRKMESAAWVDGVLKGYPPQVKKALSRKRRQAASE